MEEIPVRIYDRPIGGYNMRKYMNTALCYSILAMAGGVFYREFTKFNSFSGKTALSVVHTHYFMLGMFFFLVLVILEKNFQFSSRKTDKAVLLYNIGLNLTAVMLLTRGILQVLGTPLSSAINAMLSGFAGIGHILLAIGIVLILLQLRKKIS